jgi:hypothetical protein
VPVSIQGCLSKQVGTPATVNESKRVARGVRAFGLTMGSHPGHRADWHVAPRPRGTTPACAGSTAWSTVGTRWTAERPACAGSTQRRASEDTYGSPRGLADCCTVRPERSGCVRPASRRAACSTPRRFGSTALRPRNARGPGVSERVDESQHHWKGRLGARYGEQLRHVPADL